LSIATLLPAQTPNGYWSFDNSDISGTTVTDLSGHGLNGTIQSATSVTGAIGQALNFNGSNASITIPNDGSLAQLTGSLTLAVWIKTTNATRQEAVISKYDVTSPEIGYLLHTTPGGTVALRLGGANAPSTTLRENFDTTHINDGNWHHIAVVITQGVGVSFYVDGLFSSSTAVNVVPATTTAVPFQFGITGYMPYGNYFTGSMDEVYLFQQALTAAQVFALYANSAAGPGTLISGVTISGITSSGATISWSTSTSTDTQVVYGLSNAYGQATALNSTATMSHSANLTGLQASTQYHFRVQSRDSSGVLAVSSDATFTTMSAVGAANTLTDTTVSDFSAGGGTNTYVSHMADGEVILSPTLGTEFAGTTLSNQFFVTPWQSGGYATVGNNMVSILAARITGPSYAPVRSLEFTTTFTQDPDQHIGFAVDLANPPWAIFSTQSNRAMNIRTTNGSTTLNQLVPGNFLGSPHDYRIDWTSTGFTYSIDGVQVGTHTIPVTSSMNPVASNNFLTNAVLNVNWMHVTPYAASATFTSRVMNAGAPVTWSSASWDSILPAGTSLQLKVRMGNAPTPDASWSAFQTVPSSGSSISGSGQYIQYQAVLATSDVSQTPVLEDVNLVYNGLISNVQVSSLQPTSAMITWTTANPATSEVDYGPSGYSLSTPSNNTPVTNHSVPLSNLQANTLYHFRVDSNDGTGTVFSGDFTFTTPSAPDVTPPTISISSPAAGQVSGNVTLSATAMDNVGVVKVQFLLDNSPLGSPLTSPTNPPNGYQMTWNTATVGNGPHTLGANAYDAAGNMGSATTVSVTVANPTTQSFVDTTVSDFSAGSGTNVYIAQMNDGEVIQNPALGSEFNSLPLGWTSQPWSSGGTSSTSGGLLRVDGALFAPSTYFGPGTSMEFSATFPGDFGQHVGFAVDLATQPWAIFSTAGGGTTLYIRSNNGSQNLTTALAGNYVGAPHNFRIDWTATGFVYWIDGLKVGTHAVVISQSMRPAISDYYPAGTAVTVDWLHVSPFASPVTFDSRVFNASAQVGWNKLSWDAVVPTNTTLAMSYRTGNTPSPDGTWTAFTPIASSGGALNGSSQYIQYQAVLSSTDPTLSVVLQDVMIQYNTAFANIQASSVTTNSATITWTTSLPSTSQVDYGTSTNYANSVPSSPDPNMVTTHAETLTNLQPSTLYHYRVKGFDGTTQNVSGDFTFTTAAVADLTPPSIGMTAPTITTVMGIVTVSASASDNVGVVKVQFLLDGVTSIGPLQAGQGAGPATYTYQWDSTTVSNGPHTLSATAWDAAGNHTTATPISVTVNNPLIRTVTDTTVSDFSQGTGTNYYVSQTTDGEVIQSPTVGSEFTTFPSGWVSIPWASGGGVTISNGSAAVDAAILYTNGLYSPVRSIEFVATFGGDPSEHAGFANDMQSAPWAVFSTFTGGALYARTNNGSQSTVTLIPGSYIGTAHRYRIDWTTSGFVYWIDGTQVRADPVPITANMRPMVSDYFLGGSTVIVDWIRMSPYASPATFNSRVFDAGSAVSWTSLAWDATTPSGTTVSLSIRTGNTASPDGTWTSFTPVSTSGGAFNSAGRYAQYQAILTTTDSTQTAVLSDVTVSYTLAH
jgi:hypothetical protein